MNFKLFYSKCWLTLLCNISVSYIVLCCKLRTIVILRVLVYYWKYVKEQNKSRFSSRSSKTRPPLHYISTQTQFVKLINWSIYLDWLRFVQNKSWIVFCQLFDLRFCALQYKYKSNPRARFWALFESCVYIQKFSNFPNPLEAISEIYFHSKDPMRKWSCCIWCTC